MMMKEKIVETALAYDLYIKVLSPEVTDHIRRAIFDRFAPFDTAHGVYNYEQRAGTPYLAEDFVNFYSGAHSYLDFWQPYASINHIINPFYLLADFFHRYNQDEFIVFYPKRTETSSFTFLGGEHLHEVLVDACSRGYDVFITNAAYDFLLLWADDYDAGLSALGKAKDWLVNILYGVHRLIGMPVDALVAKQVTEYHNHPAIHPHSRDMPLYVLDIQPPDQTGTLSIQFAYDEAQHRKITRVNFTACTVQNWLTYRQPRGRPGVFLAHLQLPQQSGQIIPAKILCDAFEIEFTYAAMFVDDVALS